MSSRPAAGRSRFAPTPLQRRGDESGSVIVTLAAILFVLSAVFLGFNVVVVSYGRGVVRTAVDEGARAGAKQLAPGGPVAACQAKAAEVMGNLLSGPYGQGVVISCAVNGPLVVANATGQFPGWLPPLGGQSFNIAGRSHLENNPPLR